VRLPSLRIKIFGAITTVLLLLLGCALTVPMASAAVAESKCEVALSPARLNSLLDRYAQAYSAKQSYWEISDQISDGLFCLGKSSQYVSDLKIIVSIALSPVAAIST
jgi:hypothetical protein